MKEDEAAIEAEPTTGETGQTDAEAVAPAEGGGFFSARKQGCILRMIVAWMLIGLVLILGIVYVRSHVNRIPEEIDGYVRSRFQMALPDRFQPYSMNNFMGTLAISYWDQKNVREDGRTFNLFSLFQAGDWPEQGLDEVVATTVPRLSNQLVRNEFNAHKQRVEVRELEGVRFEIHVFEGLASVDDQLVDAATCFRYVATMDGPMQLQTMGVNETFGVEEQIALLASVQALVKEPGPQ